MHKFKDRPSFLFVLLGSITSGLVKFAYNLGLFQNPMLNSAHDGKFDPPLFVASLPYKFFIFLVDETRFDPSPFFIVFGMVAFVLGLYYSGKKELVKNKLWNRVLITFASTLCGFAYSLWLHFYAALDGYDVQNIPLFPLTVSFAIGLFVYIFCSSFLIIPNRSNTVITSTIFSLLVLIFVISTVSLGYTISTALSIGLVSYLIVLVLLYLTFGYHYDEYFGSIFVNILSFSFTFSLLPFFGIISFLLLPIGTVFFLIRLIKHHISESNKTPVQFERKFSHTIEWLLSLPVVLLNCTVYGSVFAIIPYLSITQYLRESNQLNGKNFRRSYVLGFWSFVVYLLFFMFYNSIIWFLAYDIMSFMIVDVIFWILMGYIASKSLSYCLFEIK